MGTLFNREHEPPEQGPEDATYAVVRSLVGLVPGAADLLTLIIAPPLARRQQEWMNDLAEAVRRLEATLGITPEALRDNPAFIDAVLVATQAALRTSHDRKRQALRNAALNAALPGAPPATQQQVFLSLVDRFSDMHLALLQLFQDPRRWRLPNGAGLRPADSMPVARDLVELAFPQFRAFPELVDAVWWDLHAAQLVDIATLVNRGEGPDGVMKKRTTALGDALVAFITSPI